MRARVAKLAGTFAVWAWLVTPADAQLAGPFCLTLGAPQEAIALFISGNANQFVGTGIWQRRPVSVAGALVEGSFHLNFALSAFPPQGNPLSCGAVIDPATGEGPARCARLEGGRIDGTLRGVSCVPPASPADRVFILGHETAAEQVRAALDGQGFLSHVNGTLMLGGTALITVSALDGPMPQTVAALDRLVGDDASRAAIVLLDVPMVDPELVALVTLETRELLAQYIGKPRADAVPVLRLDAADFAAAVRGLPVVPVAINPR
jgi:hypothetical protein